MDFTQFTTVILGFPGGSDGKESACNAGDSGLTPGSGRSPGEGNGYPSLPGESHGQKSLVSYSPRDRKQSDTTEQLTLSPCTSTVIRSHGCGQCLAHNKLSVHVSITCFHPLKGAALSAGVIFLQ